jgi:hypothetical protein
MRQGARKMLRLDCTKIVQHVPLWPGGRMNASLDLMNLVIVLMSRAAQKVELGMDRCRHRTDGRS